MEAKAKRK
jgi:hypothetical protein